MTRYTLYKKEKLCSACAIDALFGAGGAHFSRLCYPIRAVARPNPARRSDAPLAFLISVPKKRLHHAVDRVLMRRRIREAFRLNRHSYATDPAQRLDLAFVYVGDRPQPYASVEKAMCRILEALAEKYPAVNLSEYTPTEQ